MMLPGQSLTLLAVSLAATLVDARKVDCKGVGGALSDVSKLGEAATAFCESFLGIHAATTTVAITAPTSVVYATTTTTVVSSVCDAAVTGLALPARDLGLGARHDIVLPTGLAKYESDVISSACSYLGLKTPPPVTATVTVPPTIVTSTTTATACLTCAPSGGQCDLNNPGACCNLVCINAQPNPTCY